MFLDLFSSSLTHYLALGLIFLIYEAVQTIKKRFRGNHNGG